MNNCEIILAGFGGQGILFAGKILAHAAMIKNKHISWLPSYGPEMRGGTANCSVIISDESIGSPISLSPNILIAMNRPSLDKFENDVVKGGTIIIDSSLVDRKAQRNDVNAFYINATETAEALNVKKLANMIILGAMIKNTGLFSIDEINKTINSIIPDSKADLRKLNMQAMMAGYEI